MYLHISVLLPQTDIESFDLHIGLGYSACLVTRGVHLYIDNDLLFLCFLRASHNALNLSVSFSASSGPQCSPSLIPVRSIVIKSRLPGCHTTNK